VKKLSYLLIANMLMTSFSYGEYDISKEIYNRLSPNMYQQVCKAEPSVSKEGISQYLEGLHLVAYQHLKQEWEAKASQATWNNMWDAVVPQVVATGILLGCAFVYNSILPYLSVKAVAHNTRSKKNWLPKSIQILPKASYGALVSLPVIVQGISLSLSRTPQQTFFTFDEMKRTLAADRDIEVDFMEGICAGKISSAHINLLSGELLEMRRENGKSPSEVRSHVTSYLKLPADNLEKLQPVPSEVIEEKTRHLNTDPTRNTTTIARFVNRIVFNSNNPESSLTKRLVLALIGPGGTGKTWFVEQILTQLTGLKVCAVPARVFDNDGELYGQAAGGYNSAMTGALLECMFQTGSRYFVFLVNDADLLMKGGTDSTRVNRVLSFLDTSRKTFYNPYMDMTFPLNNIPVVLTANTADFAGAGIASQIEDALRTRLSYIYIESPRKDQVEGFLTDLTKEFQRDFTLDKDTVSELTSHFLSICDRDQICGPEENKTDLSGCVSQAEFELFCNYRTIREKLTDAWVHAWNQKTKEMKKEDGSH
jgi:hypothetical protein